MTYQTRPITMAGLTLGMAMSLSLPTASVLAGPPGSGYEILWADEFANDTLNTMKWQSKYPWGRTHNHDAYAADENVILGDGTVTLLAERVSHPSSNKAFTTGVISTGYNKFTVKEGYIEASILLPDTTGSWPAFWGLYTGWPPEADIMEYPIGAYNQSEYHTAFHYKTSGGGNASGAGKVNPSGVGDLGGTYHRFGMDWKEDDYVRFYFDGQQVSSFGTNSAIAQMEHMYLILNYAVGGWPGTPNQTQWPDGHTDETKIDWVRVWQKTSGNTEHDWTLAGDGSWGDDANWATTAPAYGRQDANFGTVASSTVNVDWSKFKTVGDIDFDGTTAYTIGNGDESLMFAGQYASSWTYLTVDDTTGSADHTFDTQIELWSNLSVRNQAPGSTLRLNGDIIGDGQLNFNGTPDGSTMTVVAGDVYNDKGIKVQNDAAVSLSGKLFADGTPAADARLVVQSNGRLAVGSFNLNGNLGSLPEESQYIEIDNGTLFIANANTERGFTILGGGATIESSTHPLASVSLQASADPGKQIVSSAGGDLTLTGGNGIFNKTLPGAGGLVKAGSGTWYTNAAHTYTGNTSIEQGTLSLTGAASIASSPFIDVQAGATLNVSGLSSTFNVVNGQTLNNDSDTTVVGDVIAASGSTVSGDGTFANNLTAQAGSVVRVGSISPSSAVTIGTYEFTGASLAATDADGGDGVTFSPITIGAGFGNLFDNGGDGNSLRISGDDTQNGTGDALTNNAYLSFTVSNNSGDDLALASIELDYDANNPFQYSVARLFSDVQGFADITDDLVGNFGYEQTAGDSLAGHDVVSLTASSSEFGANVSASDFTIADGSSITFYLPWIDGSGVNTRYTDVDNLLVTAIQSGIPLASSADLAVLGDYTQDLGATLEIELFGSSDYDRLVIGGALNAGGDLDVLIANGGAAPQLGDVYDILDFASALGTFDNVNLPALTAGLFWDTSALYTTGELSVTDTLGIPGDLDGDGFVGLSDLDIILNNWNQSIPPGNPLADPTGDNFVGLADLDIVLNNWNAGTPPGSNVNIPEPGGLWLFGLAGVAALRRRLMRG